MSQSMYLMAFHESRKKRLLKLFRRAKGRHDDTEHTQASNGTNSNGSSRKPSAIGSPLQDRKLEQAPSPPQGDRVISQRTPSPNDTAASQVGNYQLPVVPREREFSSNFPGLTLDHSGDGRWHHASPAHLDEGRNSENIADRNMTATASETPSIRLIPRNSRLSASRSQPLMQHIDTHSGNAANWDVVRNESLVAQPHNDSPSPLKVNKRNSTFNQASASQPKAGDVEVRDASRSVTPFGMEGSQTNPPFDGSETQKPRDASWSITPLAMEGYEDRSPFESMPNTPLLEDTRSSLDKPLPPTPSTTAPRTPPSASNKASRQRNINPGHDKQDSVNPLNLDDAAIYRHPDTVSVHQEQAPAVKHEKVIENQHEVRQEVITREVHDHDIYHRILPIKDIEVKPTRHYVPVQDGYLEVDEDDLPGRTRQKTNWAVAEFVSKSMPDIRGAASARRFTARKFEGNDGDDREYIGPDGHPVKEKWWVHPPTLENNTRDSYPFHFGSENPKDDGLKATLPAGNVIGISPRLMEKRNGASTEQIDS
ncbi:hypothetical protein Q7P37_008473 [Cladosporium fusiforme]